MTHTQQTDAAKAKAEATFKRRQEQARDGAIAMAQYLAAQEATRAKTERLRALRLAQEAAAAAQPASGKPAGTRSLSDQRQKSDGARITRRC